MIRQNMSVILNEVKDPVRFQYTERSRDSSLTGRLLAVAPLGMTEKING